MASRVLIVKNSPFETMSLKAALSEEDVSFEITPDLGQALALMEADPLDVIILDLGYPLREKIAFLTAIRQQFPECLVIAELDQILLNGLADSVHAGLFDCLIKPVAIDDVAAVVTQAIKHQASIRTRQEESRKSLIRRIIATINHEVNNPLTSILGTAELIFYGTDESNAKLRREINTIIEQCLRIRSVTSRLRDLADFRSLEGSATDAIISLVDDQCIQSAPLPRNPGASSPNHVLLVDGNQFMIPVLRRLLDSEFKITGSDSGKKALEFLATFMPDVIFVDMLLTDIECEELISKIRCSYPNLPVVVMASYHDEGKINRAIRSGACGFLYKPIRFEEFRHAVHSALGC